MAGLDMVGGGDLGAGLQVPQGAPMGGLEQASADPFSAAIENLNARSMHLKPDQIDPFARATRGAPPSFNELRSAIDDEMRAGAEAQRYYADPPIDRSVPWLKMAAGMFAPTRTGNFSESLSKGIEGYSEGAEKINAQELALGREGAGHRYTMARNKTVDLEKLYSLGLSEKQIEALLARSKQQMMMTPAIKEFSVAEGVPVEDIVNGNLTTDQRKKLDRYILLARGSTQMKNADAILNVDPKNPAFPKLVNTLSNSQLMGKFATLAETMTPKDAYEGQPVEAYQQAMQSTLNGLIHKYISGNLPPEIAATLGETAAGPGPAAAPPAARAPAAAPPEDDDVSDLPRYILSREQPQAQRPGVLKSKGQEKQVEIAAEDYKTNVLPAVANAEKIRSAVLDLDQIDPTTTPMAGIVQALGKAGSVIGLPSSNVLMKESSKLDTADKIIKTLQNDILMLAKGVQTEGDAKRAMAQIASLSDRGEVFDATKTLMKAISDRAMDKQSFFNSWAQKNNGSYVGAAESWAKHTKDIPLIKRVSYDDGKAGYMSYSDYVKATTEAGHKPKDLWRTLRGGR